MLCLTVYFQGFGPLFIWSHFAQWLISGARARSPQLAMDMETLGEPSSSHSCQSLSGVDVVCWPGRGTRQAMRLHLLSPTLPLGLGTTAMTRHPRPVVVGTRTITRILATQNHHSQNRELTQATSKYSTEGETGGRNRTNAMENCGFHCL